MTKREKHEIAVVVRATINDECDEIRDAYKVAFGSLKGLRKYVRQEALAFWTDPFDPYLDEEYLDYAWIRVGNKIINYDDFWQMVKSNLEHERHG